MEAIQIQMVPLDNERPAAQEATTSSNIDYDQVPDAQDAEIQISIPRHNEAQLTAIMLILYVRDRDHFSHPLETLAHETQVSPSSSQHSIQ
jgi:hypothetical protein